MPSIVQPAPVFFLYVCFSRALQQVQLRQEGFRHIRPPQHIPILLLELSLLCLIVHRTYFYISASCRRLFVHVVRQDSSLVEEVITRGRQWLHLKTDALNQTLKVPSLIPTPSPIYSVQFIGHGRGWLLEECGVQCLHRPHCLDPETIAPPELADASLVLPTIWKNNTKWSGARC